MLGFIIATILLFLCCALSGSNNTKQINEKENMENQNNQIEDVSENRENNNEINNFIDDVNVDTDNVTNDFIDDVNVENNNETNDYIKEDLQIDPISINLASLEQLRNLPGINLIKAKKVIQMRQNGVYILNWNDLQQKLDLKEYEIEKLKSYLTFEHPVDINKRRVDL